jgi:hypothetical protein
MTCTGLECHAPAIFLSALAVFSFALGKKQAVPDTFSSAPA